MANSFNPGMNRGENTAEIKKILRRINTQLEGMGQATEYLSLHIEQMEAKMPEQSMKSNKFASDIEMHYNIILGFARDS